MGIPASLNQNLALPVICAPMFIISNPDLVIAQCKGGVIGSFPALNARPKDLLDEWLTRIKAELAADPNAAPFAVNQIIHPSNERLEHDMALCVKHEVPLIITSLSAPTQIVPHVHAYGGKVFHDVISVRHAEKALEEGADGLMKAAIRCAPRGSGRAGSSRRAGPGLAPGAARITDLCHACGAAASQPAGVCVCAVPLSLQALHDGPGLHQRHLPQPGAAGAAALLRAAAWGAVEGGRGQAGGGGKRGGAGTTKRVLALPSCSWPRVAPSPLLLTLPLLTLPHRTC